MLRPLLSTFTNACRDDAQRRQDNHDDICPQDDLVSLLVQRRWEDSKIRARCYPEEIGKGLRSRLPPTLYWFVSTLENEQSTSADVLQQQMNVLETLLREDLLYKQRRRQQQRRYGRNKIRLAACYVDDRDGRYMTPLTRACIHLFGKWTNNTNHQVLGDDGSMPNPSPSLQPLVPLIRLFLQYAVVTDSHHLNGRSSLSHYCADGSFSCLEAQGSYGFSILHMLVDMYCYHASFSTNTNDQSTILHAAQLIVDKSDKSLYIQYSYRGDKTPLQFLLGHYYPATNSIMAKERLAMIHVFLVTTTSMAVLQNNPSSSTHNNNMFADSASLTNQYHHYRNLQLLHRFIASPKEYTNHKDLLELCRLLRLATVSSSEGNDNHHDHHFGKDDDDNHKSLMLLLQQQDSQLMGNTPLALALSLGRFQMAITLYSLYPEASNIPNNMGEYPLHLLLHERRNNNGCNFLKGDNNNSNNRKINKTDMVCFLLQQTTLADLVMTHPTHLERYQWSDVLYPHLLSWINNHDIRRRGQQQQRRRISRNKNDVAMTATTTPSTALSAMILKVNAIYQVVQARIPSLLERRVPNQQ